MKVFLREYGIFALTIKFIPYCRFGILVIAWRTIQVIATIRKNQFEKWKKWCLALARFRPKIGQKLSFSTAENKEFLVVLQELGNNVFRILHKNCRLCKKNEIISVKFFLSWIFSSAWFLSDFITFYLVLQSNINMS